MKAKKIMYAWAAVIQFTYKFNKENNTHIKYTSEVLDGSLFVTIDFKETPFQLIFEYTYELGSIQNHLAGKREQFLPLESYPFPPEDDKNIADFRQTKQKLFDGDEGECLQKVFNADDQKATVTDFYNSPLRALKKEIDAESFDKVIEESKFNLINSHHEIYTSEEGLDVHYLIRNKLIYLFSYGEYQPGRYMLFLEGVWYYKPWNKDE
ncbi:MULTISPECIES: hypothetical protein [Chryseobacterium]|uniref:hypothetical protein n=1 Tax=Chryseobacterium TaxID=59732 RepID=UPI001296950F|nr:MULTISPECIES: hypothetical protein [Chryseobacterium]MDR6919761.1 hypothetical protein [Chryseobacterium sp. 2987]